MRRPGNGLARVEQDRAGPCDRVDILACQRRDAREMLQRVQRRAFGGEHCPRIAAEPHDCRAMLDVVAVLRELLDLNVRIERPEKRRRNVEPGNDDRLPRIHLRGEACVGRDRRVRRDVAAAAEILGQHALDEFVQIETLGKRHAQPLGERVRPDKLSARLGRREQLPAPSCHSISLRIVRLEPLAPPGEYGDRYVAFCDIDCVEALLLLTNPGRCRSARLDDQNAVCTLHEIARISAGSMMVVASKDHVDTRFFDRVERKLLPPDRSLHFAANLEREERVMGDENANHFARRS